MRLSVVLPGRATPLYNAEPGRAIYKLAQKHERNQLFFLHFCIYFCIAQMAHNLYVYSKGCLVL